MGQLRGPDADQAGLVKPGGLNEEDFLLRVEMRHAQPEQLAPPQATAAEQDQRQPDRRGRNQGAGILAGVEQ
jgi:hypothetical protein